MAAMAKIAAGADRVPWYHELKDKKQDPVESEEEIKERIKNGVNRLTGGSAHEPI